MLMGYRWPVLSPVVLTPLAVALTRRLAASREPQERIVLLGATARLLAAYGVLLSLGVVIG
jgi:1,4-dihydroxy-2-naphthoate octaprenyltransferase